MALPLSQDLRERLVRAVAEGSSMRQAAARFDVSPSSAIKLMQRVRATGSTAPAKIGGYRRPLLDRHEALLRELTTAKPGSQPWSRSSGRWRSAGSRPVTSRPSFAL